MDPWATRIEKFAKPAYKNLSVQIQNTTSEEIETVLDAIAADANWTYREIKEKKEHKLISYQTTRIGEWNWNGNQIIEYIFLQKDNAIRLDIESRYQATTNKIALIAFSRYIAFYDLIFQNRLNIQHISKGLQFYFKDRITFLNDGQTIYDMETNVEKISKLSVILALIKIYQFIWLIFFLLIILFIFLYILRSAISSYISVIFNH